VYVVFKEMELRERKTQKTLGKKPLAKRVSIFFAGNDISIE
jgi:hypothetical protein